VCGGGGDDDDDDNILRKTTRVCPRGKNAVIVREEFRMKGSERTSVIRCTFISCLVNNKFCHDSKIHFT
jgi:hypothetical protein